MSDGGDLDKLVASGDSGLPLTAETIGALLSAAYTVYRFQFKVEPVGDERGVQEALKALPGDWPGYLKAVFTQFDRVALDARTAAQSSYRQERAQFAKTARELVDAHQQLIHLQSDANKAFDNFQRLSASVSPDNLRITAGLRAILQQLSADSGQHTPAIKGWGLSALAIGAAVAIGWALLLQA
jgi:hypothetical protein